MGTVIIALSVVSVSRFMRSYNLLVALCGVLALTASMAIPVEDDLAEGDDLLAIVKGSHRGSSSNAEANAVQIDQRSQLDRGDSDDASEDPPTMAPCVWPKRNGDVRVPDGKDRLFCPKHLSR